jgi:hypothetical protein
LKENVTEDPGVGVLVVVKAGKALTGRVGFELGQLVMKAAVKASQ